MQSSAPATTAGRAGPRLSDLLPASAIALGQSASDWRAAVTLAGERLVATGRVDPAYIPEMIHVVESLGPYIVIAPGIALAHARPGPAVHGVAFSIVTLARPVRFGHPTNDPVDLVVGLAAPGDSEYVDALAALATALSDEDRRARIRAATDPQQVRAAFAEVEAAGDGAA